MNFVRGDVGSNLSLDDFETRATLSDHQDLRLWLRMMAIHKLINNEARRKLRRVVQNKSSALRPHGAVNAIKTACEWEKSQTASWSRPAILPG